MPEDKRPVIPAGGAIPSDSETMPTEISYNAAARRLMAGSGFVDNVPPAVWDYKISGTGVVLHRLKFAM